MMIAFFFIGFPLISMILSPVMGIYKALLLSL